MDLKRFVENLKIKKFGKNHILILFLCGVLLMVFRVPVKEKEEDVNKTEESISDESTLFLNSTDYTQYLERRLEKMLSQMEGAGDVACMVTLSQSAEQIIEKDMEVTNDSVTETDSQGGSRTTNQSSRNETTIYNGDENKTPYVSKEISPKVEGVLVLAEGGENAVVVKNINEAIEALFGIPTHKIRIVKKGG